MENSARNRPLKTVLVTDHGQQCLQQTMEHSCFTSLSLENCLRKEGKSKYVRK